MSTKSLSDIPYSVLDLATINRGQNAADAIRNSVDLARHVEQWGYTRFWMAEHHNMENIASSATSVLLGHVAGATETIRIGSGGIMLPNHSPLVIAEQFGTLATIYPGRVDLGLGRAPGTDPATAHAIRADRMQAVRAFPENVRKLQRYLSSDSSDSIRAIPGRGTEIPLWILGSSTDSAHLAAAMGLPYAFASHFSPQQLGAALRIYHENFQPSKQEGKPRVMVCANVIAAETDEEAEYLSTSMKQMFRGVFTGDREPLAPPVENMEQVWNMREQAAVQQMLKYTFIGGPDTIREQVSEFFRQTAADEILIASYVFDHRKRLESHRIFSEVMREE